MTKIHMPYPRSIGDSTTLTSSLINNHKGFNKINYKGLNEMNPDSLRLTKIHMPHPRSKNASSRITKDSIRLVQESERIQ